jgi:hypothetical protein
MGQRIAHLCSVHELATQISWDSNLTAARRTQAPSRWQNCHRRKSRGWLGTERVANCNRIRGSLLAPHFQTIFSVMKMSNSAQILQILFFCSNKSIIMTDYLLIV